MRLNTRPPPLPVLAFLLIRIPILLASTYEGLRGYGDFIHFYNLASLPGLPFLQYWSEFPPLFPFLNKGVFALAGGVEHAYTYLLILFFLAADLGSVLLAFRLEALFYPEAKPWRSVLFAAVLGGLAYAWWYFDSLALFFTLLAFYFAFSKRSAWFAGGALGLGILTKLFPLLILPALWRTLPPRRAAVITACALGLTVVVYGGLWLASPAYSSASLRSQTAKGSWETAWAMLDGNYHTGNFGPEEERLDPRTASIARGNPAVVNPLLSLLVFGALGLALFFKSSVAPANALAAASFSGLTWVIFFLWSPGWSPQWVLYMLPFILLTLPERIASLLTVLFVLVNLLEWPLLLSRGLFSALPLTIFLRTMLLILLAVTWWQDHSRSLE